MYSARFYFIFCVIRLDELKNKYYIVRQNYDWHLTEYKGTCVALTLVNDLSEIGNVLRIDLDTEKFIKLLKQNQDIAPMMKKQAELLITEIANKMRNDPEGLSRNFRDFTNEMISKGVNLDDMSKDEFSIMLASRLFLWYFDGTFRRRFT